jgi:hypothetical protein
VQRTILEFLLFGNYVIYFYFSFNRKGNAELRNQKAFIAELDASLQLKREQLEKLFI